MRRHRLPVLIAACAIAVAPVAGCGGDTGSTVSASSDAATATAAGVRVVDGGTARGLIDNGATVIDVRTADEFAEGHVKGARNIPVEDDGFDAAIAPLARDAVYVVYCRSGRRSAIAAERMKAAGFRDIVDAGAFDALAAAGVPTAQ